MVSIDDVEIGKHVKALVDIPADTVGEDGVSTYADEGDELIIHSVYPHSNTIGVVKKDGDQDDYFLVHPDEIVPD